MTAPTATAAAPAPPPGPVEPAHVNEIYLRGRLGAAPTIRVLPSGAQVALFRLVVTRQLPAPEGAAVSDRDQPSGRRPTVDTLECAAWDEPLQASLAAHEPGEVLEVRGALRRRFWRTPAGPSSRYEIEVSEVQGCPAPPPAPARLAT